MLIRIALPIVLLMSACSAATDQEAESTAPATTATAGAAASGLIDSDGVGIPPSPQIPSGPLSDALAETVERIWVGLNSQIDPEDVAILGDSGDVRLGWLLSDLLRFFQGTRIGSEAVNAFVAITGVERPEGGDGSDWRFVTDYMMAWDVPAPPGYADLKERLYTIVEPGWQPFFADAAASVDWRFVSWGGVLIDDRPLGDLAPCLEGCIPAIDDPPVTDAAGGDWYPDDAIVFGVTLNGESRAYPKNIMEVHEMVNDTLGGRRIGMPYCTLCGSAQAFLTDSVPEGFDTLVLRTSGLLSRSNKVMYDLDNGSMFDTFLGTALTGPLREAGLTLEQVTVVTSTWGDWKAAHPDTTIVAEDGGRGRSYPADPLRGRDDNGPIFPVGDVDPRLPVQEQVVGVIAPGGSPVAFPAAAATDALTAGNEVTFAGVTLIRDAGGLRAFDSAGEELPTHQSFWFAWSQFRPETLLWER